MYFHFSIFFLIASPELKNNYISWRCWRIFVKQVKNIWISQIELASGYHILLKKASPSHDEVKTKLLGFIPPVMWFKILGHETLIETWLLFYYWVRYFLATKICYGSEGKRRYLFNSEWSSPAGLSIHKKLLKNSHGHLGIQAASYKRALGLQQLRSQCPLLLIDVS